MASKAALICVLDVAKPLSTVSVPSAPGRTIMFPPEPVRVLILLRSLRARILAVLPEALNSAPVRDAFWAKSFVSIEGNTELATVIKLPVMNDRRDVVKIL
jgi:hypothetical protein